jgi:hypothetical protein
VSAAPSVLLLVPGFEFLTERSRRHNSMHRFSMWSPSGGRIGTHSDFVTTKYEKRSNQHLRVFTSAHKPHLTPNQKVKDLQVKEAKLEDENFKLRSDADRRTAIEAEAKARIVALETEVASLKAMSTEIATLKQAIVSLQIKDNGRPVVLNQ